MATLSEQQWLAELEAVAGSRRNDGGMSMDELAEAAGVSTRTMELRLKVASRKGMVRVGWRTGVSIIGRRTVTPVYTIVPRSKKKLKK